MLSEAAAAHAADVRRLLEDGVLSAAGPIEIAPGVFEDADIVVAQVLADLERAQQAHTTDPEQIRALEAEIERVYHAVETHV
jgi:hypothetical protein